MGCWLRGLNLSPRRQILRLYLGGSPSALQSIRLYVSRWWASGRALLGVLTLKTRYRRVGSGFSPTKTRRKLQPEPDPAEPENTMVSQPGLARLVTWCLSLIHQDDNISIMRRCRRWCIGRGQKERVVGDGACTEEEASYGL